MCILNLARHLLALLKDARQGYQYHHSLLDLYIQFQNWNIYLLIFIVIFLNLPSIRSSSNNRSSGGWWHLQNNFCNFGYMFFHFTSGNPSFESIVIFYTNLWKNCLTTLYILYYTFLFLPSVLVSSQDRATIAQDLYIPTFMLFINSKN